jgi:branched-chain amino acid transport system permease protein
MDYLFHILVVICIYIILSSSLDLLMGHAGLLSVSQAAFYGIGAYTYALLSIYYKLPFLSCVLVSIFLAAIVSLLVSLPSMRLHGDYFVIATFGFQIILFNVLNNWVGLTRGSQGIASIPRPTFLGWSISSTSAMALLAFVFTTLSYISIRVLVLSPFGRVLHAIREDEIFAQSLGKHTLLFKVKAFAISAGLAAVAGSLYASYITYIDPSSFQILESVLLASMVIIGGAGSLWGPVAGAVLLVILPEILRFLGLPNAIAANMRQIIYGLLIVILMLYRPQGLLGRYNFGR